MRSSVLWNLFLLVVPLGLSTGFLSLLQVYYFNTGNKEIQEGAYETSNHAVSGVPLVTVNAWISPFLVTVNA